MHRPKYDLIPISNRSTPSSLLPARHRRLDAAKLTQWRSESFVITANAILFLESRSHAETSIKNDYHLEEQAHALLHSGAAHHQDKQSPKACKTAPSPRV